MISEIEAENHIQTEIVIENIESFYNYTTKDESSEIYTSILSNNKSAILIEKLNSIILNPLNTFQQIFDSYSKRKTKNKNVSGRWISMIFLFVIYLF